MHKVRIHAAKSKMKKVKEVVSKTKIVINTAAPVPIKKDEDESTEQKKKKSINVMQIIEVTPVTKADDITSLIKTSDSEEPKQEQAPSQKSLEPLVRDAAKTTESNDSKDGHTYDARIYESKKSHNYNPNTSANYKSVQKNSSQNTQYRVGIESERNSSTLSSNLQPNWDERENPRLQDERSLARDNLAHYEQRQYSTPNEEINASHKRRRQPWE